MTHKTRDRLMKILALVAAVMEALLAISFHKDFAPTVFLTILLWVVTAVVGIFVFAEDIGDGGPGG